MSPRFFYLATGLTISSGLLFTVSHAVVRQINQLGPHLHPFEIAFFSSIFSIIFYLPLFLKSGLRVLHTVQFPMHLLRAMFNAAALSTFYTALTLTPLADVVALSLTVPLFVTLGALVFLGELIKLRRLSALFAGGVGAICIIRPGFETFNIGLLFVLLSAIFTTGSKLLAKQLTETDSAITCSAYIAILQSPILLVAALFFWKFPTGPQVIYMIFVGLIVAGAHVCMVQAYKFAEVTAMEPFHFLRFVWAAIIGFVAFQETPDIWTFVGAAIVVVASSYISRRESIKASSSSLPPTI